jgi:hypothetical protein
MKKFALIAMMVVSSVSMASADSFRISASVQARGQVTMGSRYRQPVRHQAPVYQAPVYQQPVRQQWIPAPQTRIVTVRDYRNQSWEVSPCEDVSYNVTGFYTGPAGDVQLTQRGNRIYGTFAKGGEMNGVIENGKITYSWTGDGYSGHGFWYVDGRGHLIGTWGSGNDDGRTTGGNWNLTLASR